MFVSGISFDEKPLSVILPAPPPPPVLLPPLPPPPPPPLPEVLSLPVASDEYSNSSSKHQTPTSVSVHNSPSQPTTSTAAPEVEDSVTLRSNFSSPVASKSDCSMHHNTAREISHSPLPSCSEAEPTTSLQTLQENQNLDLPQEGHADLPLQQIAKALCSVFAHIGSKSQELGSCSDTNETLSKLPETASDPEVSVETVDVIDAEKSKEESLHVEVVEVGTATAAEIENLLDNVIAEVEKNIEQESLSSASTEDETGWDFLRFNGSAQEDI